MPFKNVPNSSLHSLDAEGITGCHSQFMHADMPVINFKCTREKKIHSSCSETYLSKIIKQKIALSISCCCEKNADSVWAV